MEYRQAIAYLFGLEKFGWQLGLDRMLRLLAELGNPQQRFRSIHVAGTNGKGSVCAMLESMLRSSGMKTGLYTSPHLIKAEERIRLCGVDIPEQTLAQLVVELEPLFDRLQCTFFEAVTALAFLYFSREQVDIAVVETGLGGRLDATNVLHPEMTIITHIDFDHTDHLGCNLTEIAAEKAGILKPNTPCLIGKMAEEASRIIIARGPVSRARKTCRVYSLAMTDRGSWFEMKMNGQVMPIFLPLAGPHQVLNSCVAVQAAHMFSLDDKAIIQGLQETSWPGRFQRLTQKPAMIADVAHNVSGFRQLRWMLDHFFPAKEITLILGVLLDKDYEQMMQQLPRRLARVLTVTPASDRALAAEKLAQTIGRIKAEPCDSLAKALHCAGQGCGGNELICIAGSHYVVGEALQQIKYLTI